MGRSKAIIVGVFLIVSLILSLKFKIGGIVGLGTLKHVFHKSSFVLLSFLFKIMLGIGSGLNSTTCKL